MGNAYLSIVVTTYFFKKLFHPSERRKTTWIARRPDLPTSQTAVDVVIMSFIVYNKYHNGFCCCEFIGHHSRRTT